MLLLHFFHILCDFCYIISKFLNLEEEKYGNENIRGIQGIFKNHFVIKKMYYIATFVSS